MTEEMSLVVGTAGHIDHGKTHLVKALSGVDCDRLSEERKRGITIELGFAPLELPSGRVVSVIDVPGHEKFIRQMVAGASGLDAVLLVVAADEGVMPQTREHLDIIELLGVREGFVVLTKADLVDEEMLELAADDVRDLVKGTFLQDKPILAVSSVTGENLGAVMDEMDKLVDEVVPRDREGAFFMPIDRSFPVAGFGTVVTGTAYRGRVYQGDDMEILPAELDTRVRSLQVHGSSVDSAEAGQRVAMSLNGLSVDQLNRGDVVCASGVFRASSCLDVGLKVLPGAIEGISHWQRLRVHLGTSDVLARVAFLDRKELLPGEEAVAQLVLEEPVVASICQRFVVRFYSPLRTIGGGEVLSPYGKKARGRRARGEAVARLEALMGSDSREDRIAALVDFHGRIPFDDLIVQTQETRKGLTEILKDLLKSRGVSVIPVGNGIVISDGERVRLEGSILKRLETFHEEHPHQEGEAADRLVNGLFVDEDRKFGRAFVGWMVDGGVLISKESLLSLPGFEKEDDQAFQAKVDVLKGLCDDAGFQPPVLIDCPKALGMDEKEFSRFLTDVRRMGLFSVVDGTFLLSSDVEKRLLSALREVDGGITIASVRDITGSSRKFVLPLLEYLDGKGVTRRVGDRRIILGG
ncbi:selenocysteine-specific translation elongation factor [Dethiosulfovibrio sp. F2B]|uniref:selenocysteine-specific translation elongation factor n=1 Tax=Dethiosulfovibrio faecalis TaxID=2720018 RepID=UPI001F24FBE1|nr:selenocysteine-specific translation elongation factor [Dethiosulfovibrio faecalis]MCF4150310.1 selenocysteine-specific translation elongation factor [Dethiosulfovibrio faecalis]